MCVYGLFSQYDECISKIVYLHKSCTTYSILQSMKLGLKSGHMSVQDKIFSDICISRNTLLGHSSDQTGICTDQPQKCLKNVTWPTVNSYSALDIL